jgi:uncharacterized protein YndB with AHSA1/START domain
MTSAADLRVRRTVTVETSQTRAFDVFVNQLSRWWPLESHVIGEKPAQAAIVEARAGGRWFERDKNGVEGEWGHVVSIDPPNRVVLAWQLSTAFEYDPSLITEVEVRFVAETPYRTRVEFEHRGLEAYGEEAGEMLALFESPDAWAAALEGYAAVANAA